MRIELTASVRSVVPAEDLTGAHSVVTVTGFLQPYPRMVRVELTLDDAQARAFAARYREDGAVRITVDVEPVPGDPVGIGGSPRIRHAFGLSNAPDESQGERT